MTLTSTPNLLKAKRVVIKIGSLLVANMSTGHANHEWLHHLAEDVRVLRENGVEVIIVSSGGIALGRRIMKFDDSSLKLTQKQAAAACGQVLLNEAWKAALRFEGLEIAQILITTEDTEDRRRYLNTRNTLNTLIEHNVIPIINENDTITTSEIRYGDNDRLASRVAAMTEAEVLVLLSDIDGLYSEDPRHNKDAEFIPVVEKIDDTIIAMAGESSDVFSSGGMVTKIRAAQISTSSGCHMVIAYGAHTNPIKRIIAGERCTWFISSQNPLNARKHWIASSIQPNGSLTVDDGAKKALSQGNSLLAVGVTDLSGEFHCGDTVTIVDQKQNRIGVGLTTYNATEIQMLIGKKSDEYEEILGYKRGDAVIHVDDLIMESA